jgi:hypothetical protein
MRKGRKVKRNFLLASAVFAVSALATAPLTQAQTAPVPTRPTPLVTFNITGTFPPNAPTRWLMAPNASFLLEITFPQTVPAITDNTFDLDAAAVSGSLSFEGHTYPITGGGYSAHNHDLNRRDLSVTTAAGRFAFTSGGGGTALGSVNGPYVNLPLVPNRPTPTPSNPTPAGSATFLAIDAGPGGTWQCTFTNRFGQNFVTLANVLDVVGRLVLPAPQPLAER